MKSIIIRRFLCAGLMAVLLTGQIFTSVQASSISSAIPIVFLSKYSTSMDIGSSFHLTAIASNAKIPKFKSSNSKVASVNTYGLVTAKKSGSCRITAKISGAEASCNVQVRKTVIYLRNSSISLESGSTFALETGTSTGISPVYRSSRKSVATVDEEGVITAIKPGTATIGIRANDTQISCKVTVKKPTVKLNRLAVNLYRYQRIQLTASVSSGEEPIWRSNRTKVATVTDEGMVIARKHGSALITVKAGGVTKICEIFVLSPEITLGKQELTVKKGKQATLSYSISSGNPPLFKSSKSSVAKVDQLGNITARRKGTAMISVSEDGTRETCIVHVTN